jgi:hypothetical protein
MTKDDATRAAEEYVLQHKDRYKSIARKDIKQAVERVAKALKEFDRLASTKDSEKRAGTRAA